MFVPLERYFGERQVSPLRQGWRTDIAYFFMSHVLVQFDLLLVTGSTSTIADSPHSPRSRMRSSRFRCGRNC